MPRLRYMQVRNATMNAPQLSALVRNHKATVREFDFENVILINGGSWDEALAPLSDQTGLTAATHGLDTRSARVRAASSHPSPRSVRAPSKLA